MPFDDVLTYSQAQPDAFAAFLSSEKRLENSRQNVVRNPGSVIPHLDLDSFRIVAKPCRNPEIPATWHGVHGIDRQCQHHLLDLSRITLQPRQVLRQLR